MPEHAIQAILDRITDLRIDAREARAESEREHREVRTEIRGLSTQMDSRMDGFDARLAAIETRAQRIAARHALCRQVVHALRVPLTAIAVSISGGVGLALVLRLV